VKGNSTPVKPDEEGPLVSVMIDKVRSNDAANATGNHNAAVDSLTVSRDSYTAILSDAPDAFKELAYPGSNTSFTTRRRCIVLQLLL
jgi:hypothetical protein